LSEIVVVGILPSKPLRINLGFHRLGFKFWYTLFGLRSIQFIVIWDGAITIRNIYISSSLSISLGEIKYVNYN